jgi:methylphosphotriester-DNA--protein-cysteine methyltransferase
MARRRPAREKWNEATASALKLSNAMYPRDARRVAALNLPAVTPEMDAATALRIAQQVFELTPEELAAWNLANKAKKSVDDGQARSGDRKPTAQWKRSNTPRIALLLSKFPNLLSDPVTKARVTAAQKWLREQGVPARSEDALERAIRRAAKRSRQKAV